MHVVSSSVDYHKGRHSGGLRMGPEAGCASFVPDPILLMAYELFHFESETATINVKICTVM